MAAVPVMSIESAIEIFVAGVIYTLAAATVQRKLVDPKKTRAIQDKIKVKSDEIKRLMKENAPKDQISQKQSEMMPLMKESMSSSMRATIVLIPSFLVVYYLIIPFLFGGLGTATFKLNILSLVFNLDYRGVFFATVFVLGMITSISILIYDRRRAKRDAAKEEAQLDAKGANS
jgi:uncharacterized membrane protein (DUF106 family)